MLKCDIIDIYFIYVIDISCIIKRYYQTLTSKTTEGQKSVDAPFMW